MALVPVTINYLGEVEYGIWLTLYSILMWLGNLDFGLGNGLRNKLAEALTTKDFKLAKSYVSTSYAIFSAGLLLLIIIYIVIHPFLNWSALLNAPEKYFYTLNKLVLFVFILFAIQFLLKLLTSVVNADQRPAINGLMSLCTNGLTLVAIILLAKFYDRSLMFYGILSTFIPVLVFFVASIILFIKLYRNISPSLKFINLKYSPELIKIGLQFFVIQISGLIVFTTDNMIITQLFGPAQVTVYNIAYKYFFLASTFFNIINVPFWSAFTEAYIRKEYDWIKNAIRKLVTIWALISTGVIVMILLSGLIYKIWIGEEIKVPFVLSVFTGLFVIIANWNNIFAYFINGVGKVRIQFYYSLFIAVLNIPLSVFLARNMGMGIVGVIFATDICLITASIWSPIQYKKIITNKASGIWAK